MNQGVWLSGRASALHVKAVCGRPGFRSPAPPLFANSINLLCPERYKTLYLLKGKSSWINTFCLSMILCVLGGTMHDPFY